MIAGIDNGMIFGSMANLRLAPHVREGRQATRSSAVHPTRADRDGTSTHSADRSELEAMNPRSLFVEAEQLEISAEARAIFEREVGRDSAGPEQLDQAEQQQLRELKTRDAEVRAHEHAHLAAAGGLARGGASFTTERGPGGRNYAVGGEVSIDVSEVPGNPQATLAKASRIRAAALAPSDPSSADRAVAEQAAAMAAQARNEVSAERREASSVGGFDPIAQAYAPDAGTGAAMEPSSNLLDSLYA